VKASGSSNPTATSTVSFQEFYRMRESERQGGCTPPKAKKKKKTATTTTTSAPKKTNVEIKVGLAIQTDGTT
jgi:hypothetical protein